MTGRGAALEACQRKRVLGVTYRCEAILTGLVVSRSSIRKLSGGVCVARNMRQFTQNYNLGRWWGQMAQSVLNIIYRLKPLKKSGQGASPINKGASSY